MQQGPAAAAAAGGAGAAAASGMGVADGAGGVRPGSRTKGVGGGATVAATARLAGRSAANRVYPTRVGARARRAARIENDITPQRPGSNGKQRE